jgi:phytoene desaturase
VVLKPGISPFELITPETALRVDQFFKTISGDVRKNFKNPKLISTLEFPVLFLGAKPSNTPSFYNFMNYADFGLGTWHPKGGMYEVIKAMTSLATSLGVTIHTNSPAEKIIVKNKTATSIIINEELKSFDVVLSGADYHHSETLLDQKHRQYSEAYWSKKTFAPSSLLFYVGFDKKLKNIEHHNLFFDTNFETHAEDIYDNPKWPKDPLFYANFPSVTDASMAPIENETGFFLIPIAPGIQDTNNIRSQYFDIIISRFEKLTKQKVKNNIIFKESFCIKDFIKDYNSYKGNAYGMANTLSQTAFLRPKLKSKKVNNLYFTGQLTVPGPGVPPALISGKLVAELINKYHSN